MFLDKQLILVIFAQKRKKEEPKIFIGVSDKSRINRRVFSVLL